MTKENSDKLYKTSSFYLSVWLKMNGLKLITIDRNNPSRLVFVFEDSENREELFNEFWKQETIQRFIAFINDMKVEMYAKNPPVIFDREKTK